MDALERNVTTCVLGNVDVTLLDFVFLRTRTAPAQFCKCLLPYHVAQFAIELISSVIFVVVNNLSYQVDLVTHGGIEDARSPVQIFGIKLQMPPGLTRGKLHSNASSRT